MIGEAVGPSPLFAVAIFFREPKLRTSQNFSSADRHLLGNRFVFHEMSRWTAAVCSVPRGHRRPPLRGTRDGGPFYMSPSNAAPCRAVWSQWSSWSYCKTAFFSFPFFPPRSVFSHPGTCPPPVYVFLSCWQKGNGLPTRRPGAGDCLPFCIHRFGQLGEVMPTSRRGGGG